MDYTFGVKLWAIARVSAASEMEAREKLVKLERLSIALDRDGVTITEALTERDLCLL